MRGPPKSKSKPSSSPKAAVAVAAAPAPNKSSTEKSKKKVLGVCKFFLAGNCKRGSSCPFVHENTLVDVPSSSSDNSESSASSLFDDISAPAITYACPFCKASFSEIELIQHLPQHQGENPSQTCPICASQPGGDPNYKSQDLFGHFALRHGALRPGKGGAGRGKGLGSPGSAPAMGGLFGGPPRGEEHQQPPKVMKTCHAVDRSVRGMQQSRGVDFIWEYAWMVDSGVEVRKLQKPCSMCQGTLVLSEPRAILPCGCSFHTGCIAAPSPCPACKK